MCNVVKRLSLLLKEANYLATVWGPGMSPGSGDPSTSENWHCRGCLVARLSAAKDKVREGSKQEAETSLRAQYVLNVCVPHPSPPKICMLKFYPWKMMVLAGGTFGRCLGHSSALTNRISALLKQTSKRSLTPSTLGGCCKEVLAASGEEVLAQPHWHSDPRLSLQAVRYKCWWFITSQWCCVISAWAR